MGDRPLKADRRPGRGILDDLISKTILLTAVYFFVGNVYQYSYLRGLNYRASVIDVTSLLPTLSDSIVVVYSLIVWAVLTRLPDRWYQHLAELANPGTWRNRWALLLRLIGFVVSYLGLFFASGAEYRWLGYTHTTTWERILPTAAFFSRLPTLAAYLAYALLIAGGYGLYARVREGGLDQAFSGNRWWMRVMLHVGLPLVLVNTFVLLGLVVPSNYGAFKAQVDAYRMQDLGASRVEELALAGPSCLPAAVVGVGEYYLYLSNAASPRVHYLGTYAGRDLFLIIRPTSGSAPEHVELDWAKVVGWIATVSARSRKQQPAPSFSIDLCVVSQDAVRSMKMGTNP